MRRFILALVAAAAAPGVLFAAGDDVDVTMKFTITAQPKTELLVLDVLLPRSIPGRQRVLNIGYSTRPTSVFEKDGRQYAQFRIERFPDDLTIVIRVKATVYRYDYSTAAISEKARQYEKPDALKQWLIHEPYLETHSPIIQEAARRLAGKDKDETLRNCFAFVVKSLSKRPYDERDYGAVWAMQQKKGDCTEFADLLIALCRANGIPARYNEGYLLEPDLDTPKHNWVEVYTEKYGWVPFDPFYAHIRRATTFSEMRPVYLLLDVERRNSVLRNYHYWAYLYEGGGPVRVTDQFRVNSVGKSKRTGSD